VDKILVTNPVIMEKLWLTGISGHHSPSCIQIPL
jgi:hypothetical protein